MKYTNFKAFEKHLEGARPSHFADVYFVMAKEPYPRKEAWDCLMRFLVPAEARDPMSLKILDGEALSEKDLQEELQAFSLFSQRRTVCIQQGEKLKAKVKEFLEGYLVKPNRQICLVIIAESLMTTSNFYKKGEKVGVILDLNQPEKPWEKEQRIAGWLQAAAAQQHKRLEASGVQLLIQQLGADQGLLAQELEKLICYVGERADITLADVSTICLSVNLETIWQLGEAIFRRDAASALRITKALLRDGTPLLMLLRSIRNQFQTEIQVCSILEGGGTPGDVGTAFPYMKGNILNRHIQMAQGYGMSRFRQGMIQIDQAEVKAKNSGIDPELLADMLMMKLVI